MNRKYLYIFIMILTLVYLFILFGFIWKLYNQNKILDLTNKQYETMLKEKETEIDRLTSLYNELLKDEKEKIKKLNKIREEKTKLKQMEIKDEEIIIEFEKLGYKVWKK